MRVSEISSNFEFGRVNMDNDHDYDDCDDGRDSHELLQVITNDC